jgi:hypothetical protein
VRYLGDLELYPAGVRGLVCQQAMLLSRAARKAARQVLPRTLVTRIASGAPAETVPGSHAASAG